MSDTTISEAAVEAAAYAIPASVPTFERAKEVARNAISAALPHLHPQPAEQAEPSGNSGELAEQQGVREQFEAWVESRLQYGLHKNPDGTYNWITVQEHWEGWQAALAATGKQQVGEVAVAEQHVLPLAREVLAAQCRSRLEFASERDIKTGRNDANWPELEIIAHALRHPHYMERPEGGSPWKPAAQVGEVQGDGLDEVACDLPALFGRASMEGHEVGQRLAKEVQAKMRAALAARQPGAQEPADGAVQGDARAQFEAWCEEHGYKRSPAQNNCGITVPERYAHPKAQIAWEAWQAAIAARQPGAQACTNCDRTDTKVICETCAGLAWDTGRLHEFNEIRELSTSLGEGDLDELVPEEWHDKPLLRFQGAYDCGDDSVGVPARSGNVLATDQAGTVLGDFLAARAAKEGGR